ncbi:uncharacterized protein LOC126373684 [Pectinophora gossypiella]|uniref:uncharacterized protein LOC126373684 n=1 Tax=Pectinophora gossypiella TaxID=13191 RepID=UPI00214EE637|nr:uncharacterized protein LOC126373684 [Pectinophora gossypiella]
MFNHSGEDITPVTKKELKAFGLTDVLFVYAMKVLSGCPENRLQVDEMKMTDNFNWIHRRVEVKHAEILSIDTRSPLDITHHFQYDIDELPLLLNNVTSVWHNVNNTLLNETIHFLLNLQGYTNYRLVYAHKYGQNGTSRHHVPPSMRLPASPSKNHHRLNRRIHISRAAIHLLVEYGFSLDGKVFNLTPMPYGKVHFNTMPIDSVMLAAKLRNELISKEFIDVEIHYDAQYVHDIYDADFSELDELNEDIV